MKHSLYIARRVGWFALAVMAWAAPAAVAEPPAVVDAIAPPRFLAAFGRKGNGEGEFTSAIGLAINAADEIFVTDANNKTLQRFTHDGKFLGRVATGEFPGGIAIDRDGLVYVAAMMDHKISVFRPRAADAAAEAPAFELVREFGSKGTGDGQFDQPGGLTFAADGTLYVCDQVNHRVQRLTSEGKFLGKWGEYGDAAGQFGAPEKPYSRVGGPCFGAFDRDGNFYTTEPKPCRIQKFTSDGRPLGSWTHAEAAIGGFDGNPRLRGPVAILFDRQNRVWIGSTNHRVQLFTPEGRYLTGLGKFAEAGDAPGEFQIPHGLAFDSRGALFVVDTQNHRIQSFAFDEPAGR